MSDALRFSATNLVVAQDQESSDNTSEITTYNPDGSYTITEFSGPDETGYIIFEDDESGNGGPSTLSYNNADGSSSIISYSGPSGTGVITEVNFESPYVVFSTIGYPTASTAAITTYDGQYGSGSVIGSGEFIGNELTGDEIVAMSGLTALVGPIDSVGSLTIEPNASLLLQDVFASASLSFTDSAPESLILGPNAALTGPISGYGAGDTISILGDSVASATYDSNTGQLILTGSLGSSFTLSFNGSYTQDDFTVQNGSVETMCFMAGTRIATPRGDIPVEHLAIGETVRGQFSSVAPIDWIGYRHIDCRRHPCLQKLWPVRVVAGAFADGLPYRDLWLSPDHAVFVDGVLIPIKYLINDSTIRQEQRDEITYYHIELRTHDVLFAEGLPVESYLDTGNRDNFDNGGVTVQLHPNFSACTWEAEGCAPLVVTGPILESVRVRLLQRAGEPAVNPDEQHSYRRTAA